jgi:glycerophosphoryl diester phosphodiesterase
MTPLPQAFLDRPIAHRALHDAARGIPENSLAAVRAAVAAGYAIEIDIQPSQDGVPMVFHDYDLGRLTGAAGPVMLRTAAELGDVTLLGSAETIPTLTQVLGLVAGRVPLLIEVKDQDGALGPDVGPLENAVVETLVDYAGPVALMSFNPHSVAAMAALAPHLPCGLTTSAYDPVDWAPVPRAVCDHLRDIPPHALHGASFISHEAQDLTRPRVLELKAAGLAILCWTIRSPTAEAEARKIAQNITFEGYAA